jgi:hypothetical protein
MKVLALALVAVAAMANVAVAPAFAATGTTVGATVGTTVGRDNVAPCQDGNPPAPGERCRGPIDNESGGGGSALTIAVSVIVGLGIATVAFIILRRQLASHRLPGTGTGPDGARTGEQP